MVDSSEGGEDGVSPWLGFFVLLLRGEMGKGGVLLGGVQARDRVGPVGGWS